MAKNLSDIIGKKKSAAHYHNCKVIDGSNGKDTKYEFGISLLKELSLSEAFIKKGSIMELPDRAKRCADQSLNSSFYQNKYKRILPNLKQTVNTIKNYYNE